MAESDRETYDALPDEVVVFRGTCRTRPLGLSWTTERAVAAGFAKGHRGLYNMQPLVWQAIVRKQDIAGLYSDRREAEILIFDVAAVRKTLRVSP